MTDCRIRGPIRRRSQARTELLPHPDRSGQRGDRARRRPQWRKGGIEEQTRKLFEVCRLRDVPIITFVNKLDREGRDPFDLLDEIEQPLAFDVTPASWPIGMGRDFLGTYDLFADALLLFERGVHDRVTEPVHCSGLDDPKLPRLLPKEALAKLREEVEMRKGLCPPFDPQAYREGHLTPVYFGSALNNFGVRELLRGVAELPRRRARSLPKGPMGRCQLQGTMNLPRDAGGALRHVACAQRSAGHSTGDQYRGWSRSRTEERPQIRGTGAPVGGVAISTAPSVCVRVMPYGLKWPSRTNLSTIEF